MKPVSILRFFFLVSMIVACGEKETKEPLKNIGDFYEGGIIYDRVTYHSWITGKGESCIYAIASPADITVVAPWGCSGTLISLDNNSTDGFPGRHHTILISKYCSDPGIAARLCLDTTINEIKDWWLPSGIELELMYQKRDIIKGFSNGIYWSANQMDSCNAFYFDFGKGIRGFCNKDSLLHVRPIRAVEVFF